MATGPQNYDFNLNHSGSLKKRSRKVSFDSVVFQPTTSQKPRGAPIWGTPGKSFNFPQNLQFNQYQPHFQVPSNQPDLNKSAKKSNQTSSALQFETQPNFQKYAKGNCPTYPGTKTYYGSTASETDSSGSHASSELNGFKIVHKGKIVHDETEEELESPTSFGINCRMESEKFASSCLVIGPNAKEISLPTFA